MAYTITELYRAEPAGTYDAPSPSHFSPLRSRIYTVYAHACDRAGRLSAGSAFLGLAAFGSASLLLVLLAGPIFLPASASFALFCAWSLHLSDVDAWGTRLEGGRKAGSEEPGASAGRSSFDPLEQAVAVMLLMANVAASLFALLAS